MYKQINFQETECSFMLARSVMVHS